MEAIRRRSGLGLSYARVVSVLHALHRAGAIRAAFATERDRLLADLLAASESNEVEVRPETDDDSPELIVIDDPRRAPTRPVEPVLDEDGQPTLIVPIPPQSTEQPPPARRRR